jgi:hypothetical protein
LTDEAERVGFEPTVVQRTTTVFETAPFNHSGTSPRSDAIIAQPPPADAHAPKGWDSYADIAERMEGSGVRALVELPDGKEAGEVQGDLQPATVVEHDTLVDQPTVGGGLGMKTGFPGCAGVLWV